jgi:hypothetical protein
MLLYFNFSCLCSPGVVAQLMTFSCHSPEEGSAGLKATIPSTTHITLIHVGPYDEKCRFGIVLVQDVQRCSPKSSNEYILSPRASSAMLQQGRHSNNAV